MLFIPEKGAILTFVLNEPKIQTLHFQTFGPGIDFWVQFSESLDLNYEICLFVLGRTIINKISGSRKTKQQICTN